jgi:cytochrome b561
MEGYRPRSARHRKRARGRLPSIAYIGYKQCLRFQRRMQVARNGRRTSAMEQQSVNRYSGCIQALHWVTAILVLFAFIYGPGGSEERVYAASRDVDRQLHETLGLGVLALAAVQVLWRMVDARPEPLQGPRWIVVTAKVVQITLYVLLFAVPLTAIAGAWLEGHALTLLGGMRIPPPVTESHAIGAKIAGVHTWLGDAMMWVAGLHALAALYHHFVLNDSVLKSMLPRWISRDS